MAHPHPTAILACVVAAGMSMVSAGCAAAPDLGNDGRLVVAVAFYPLEDIVRAVGGDAVHIVTIVPPGEEAHEYEPTPRQATRLEQADVVFYLGGAFQPSVEQALGILPSGVSKVDLSARLSLLPLGDGTDPHVWLDPANMRTMAERVRSILTEHDPARAPAFAQNAGEYGQALAALDDAYRTGLAHCASTAIVTEHGSFGYLANAYGLTQVPIAGISPGDEPSAKALRRVAAYVREQHVPTVFFEQNLPADLSRTIASETGAATAVLNPVESLSTDELAAGADYVAAMRANLGALRQGLGCT